VSKWTGLLLTVVIAMAATAGVSQAEQDAAGERSAYERLDPETLIETLADMGMTELLRKATEESNGGEVFLAKGLVAQANRTQDPVEKARLLDQAVATYEKAIGNLPRPDTDEQLLRFYRLQLALGEAGALLRSEAPAQRLLFLQGGSEDRKAILAYTEDLVPMVAEMSLDMEDLLQDWRQDIRRLVTVVPELEELHKVVQYKLTWMRFYRALALEPGRQKLQLLADALAGIAGYAAEDAEESMRLIAMQLSGMIVRERASSMQDPTARADSHERAARFQAAVVGSSSAAGGLAVQAMFEIARNFIEWGKYDRAVDAINNLAGRGVELLGEGSELPIDLQVTMLRNYLDETRAKRESDPARAQKYTVAAQTVLLAFLDKHGQTPGIQAAFLDIVAHKYAGRSDYEDLNSLVLLAVASGLDRAGAPAEEVLKLLDMIISRTDEVSRKLRPTVLWEEAILFNRRRQNLQSAGKFMELAKDFPDDRRAFDAAVYAVVSINAVVQERRDKNQVVARSLREDFIKAAQLLLGKWADAPKAVPWYFDLGWHYDKLAQMSLRAGEKEAAVDYLRKAIEAFENVPSDQTVNTVTAMDYMNARHLALDLRVQLLRETGGDGAEVQALMAVLRKYADEAAAEAQRKQATDASLAKNLREWGAQAQLREAEVCHDLLDRPINALAILDRIPSKWPDTLAVREGRALQIRWLVGTDTAAAIQKLDEFRKDYPPEESLNLVQLVVAQIRKRIGELEDGKTNAVELTRYRQVYLRFAEILYSRAVREDAEPERVYALRQMYADALLINGKAAEALPLFEQCAKYDQVRRARAIAKLIGPIEPHIEALKQQSGDAEALKASAGQYMSDLAEYGIDPSQLDNAKAVKRSVGLLEKAQGELADMEKADKATQDQKTQAAKSVRAAAADLGLKLNRAYSGLRRILENSIPVDAANVHGMARAHLALRQYPEAIEQYKKMVKAVDRNQHPKLYWEIQVERCQATLGGYGDKPKVMANLVTLIRQLRMEDPEMGGNLVEFNNIEAEAKQKVGS